MKGEHAGTSGSIDEKKLSFLTGDKEKILNALKKAHWNKKQAAGILDIDRTTLWRKMKKYGID
jgi:transcriptional regulator of acetoin/glycerol metabolism